MAVALRISSTSVAPRGVRSSPQCAAVRPAHVKHQLHQQYSALVPPPVQQQPQQQQHRRGWVVVAQAGTPETASSGSSGAAEGQVSAALMESMQAKIKEELEADSVVVSDVHGDGRHVSIDVVSNIFDGKTSVQRQRMVYKAIWLELQETVHAVDAMTTKTPQEASA